MKKYLYLLTLSILFISCEKKEIEFSKLQQRNGVFYEVNQQKGFTGKAVTKYKNGQLKYEMTYKDGKVDGTWKSYYENGQLESQATYKDGKEDGTWKAYYENGQLYYERAYKDGKEDGPWKAYYGNGQLKYERAYKDGKLKYERAY